jgi:hypothetical protein
LRRDRQRGKAGKRRVDHVAGAPPSDAAQGRDRLPDRVLIVGNAAPAVACETHFLALALEVDGDPRIWDAQPLVGERVSVLPDPQVRR